MTIKPTTKLDPRFSDPEATPTTWDTARELLTVAELFSICSVRAGARPHVTPLVAVWLDDALHFATGPGEQKAANLRDNDNVILMTGPYNWEQGVMLVLEGRAVRQTGADLLGRLAAAWRQKWDGRWRYEVRNGVFVGDGSGEALVFTVAPRKVLAFAKNPFSQTRFTF